MRHIMSKLKKKTQIRPNNTFATKPLLKTDKFSQFDRNKTKFPTLLCDTLMRPESRIRAVRRRVDFIVMHQHVDSGYYWNRKWSLCLHVRTTADIPKTPLSPKDSRWWKTHSPDPSQRKGHQNEIKWVPKGPHCPQTSAKGRTSHR